MRVFFYFLVFILLSSNAIANERYNELFLKYGYKYNIPTSLLWAIAKHESNFNKNAINKNNNGTIDIGIMQINSIHKKSIEDLNLTLEDLYNPEINIEFGAKILSQCIKKFGYNKKALNCYNGKIENNNYATKILSNIKDYNYNLRNMIIK